MATFTLRPAPGATLKCKPTVEVAKYGDGYEQRVGTSINSMPRAWSLKFTNRVSEVVAFLETHKGEVSFNWTDPLGVSGVYVCREWSITHVGAEVFELSCDFEQVFEVGVPA